MQKKGYSINKNDIALETLPDKELKETVKECNKFGAPVKGFYTAMSIYEHAGITLQIKKDNELKIINVLRKLDEEGCLKVALLYDETQNIELVKIFANNINKAKIFKIIREAIRKKSNENQLNNPINEIYKMHKLLKNEDINHQIKYNSGKLFDSFKIQNINSYFEFGANRIKKVFNTYLWESFDNMNNKEYRCFLKSKMSMCNIIGKINNELNEEFKWQEKELETLFNKYRRDAYSEKSDIFLEFEND